MITEEAIAEIINKIDGADLVLEPEILFNAIKEYEDSKWIEFNKYDESTWPEKSNVLLLTEGGFVFEGFIVCGLVLGSIASSGFDIKSLVITHYQPLPEPRKEQK